MAHLKLRINDVDYDARAAVSKPTLGDLYDLKVQSGIGLKTLHLKLQAISQLDSLADIPEDEDAMQAILALTFLSRRYAGEKCTFDDVRKLSPGDITIVIDPEEGDELDPTSPQPVQPVGADVTEPELAQTDPTQD